MKSSYRTHLLFALLLGVSVSRADNRAELHQARLNGLDLTHRTWYSNSGPAVAMGSADVTDLVVSETTSPARFNQDHACSIPLKAGGWLTAWDDNRQGSRKIYWQRYDVSGQAFGANEVIAGSDRGDSYVDPKLAVDTSGRVYLAYRDQTNGLIVATRYTSAFEIDYGPILVNDTSLASFAGPFDMAVFPGGSMVLAWENYSGFGSTIEQRVYTSSGASLVGPVTVNTDGGATAHWVPSVAVAPGSGFLVAWEDYRNGQADIYARQYTGAGASVGADFALVPPPNDTSPQYSPCVTYSPKDRYVVGWVDLRSGQEIYVQRYDQTTGLVGTNALISSGQPLVINQDVNLCGMTSGKLQILWSASGADNTIQSLMMDSGLVPAALPKVINLTALGQRWAPHVCFNTSEQYFVAWTEFLNDDPDIAAMLFDNGMNRLLGSELTCNDDQAGAHSTRPFIVLSTDWWNVVCYVDRRHDAGDIYARSISNSGMYGSADNRVNQDAGSSLQTEPHAAVSDTRSLIVWNDGRTVGGVSGQRIYGRFGSLLAEFSDDEFMISDTAAYQVKASPKVAMAPDGQALVAWIDRRDGTAQVYARWLATDGSLDGDVFAVSVPSSDSAAANLNAVLDNNGAFNLIWLDVGLASPTVKLRRYGSDKNPAGSFDYAHNLPAVTMDQIATDIGPDGLISLLWLGTEGVSRVYLTKLDAAGNETDGPITITDSDQASPTSPSISVGNNNYVSTTWVDSRTDRRSVYYQLLAPDLGFIDTNQPISGASPEFMQQPVTDARRGRAWFVWSDPRSNGLNIYASVIVYDPTGIDDPGQPSLPGGYMLSQNYPNPFNPTTEITFSLPVTTEISLTVYNVLGQKVTTLAEGPYSAGAHTVTWDATDSRGQKVSSGVYLYRLMAGDLSRTRKMLLLK